MPRPFSPLRNRSQRPVYRVGFAHCLFVIAACVLFGIGCGQGEKDEGGPESGKWFRNEQPEGISAEEMAELGALGYLGAYEKAPGATGVTHYVHDQAWEGINLLISGHVPEATLLDMEGNLLHRWAHDFESLWPDVKIDPKRGLRVRDGLASLPNYDPDVVERLPEGLADEQMRGHTFWRRAHVYPNGDLVTIFTNFGVIKVDKDSNVLWTSRLMAHHDLFVAESGDIYVLDKEFREAPELRKNGLITDEYVVVLSPEGEIKKRVSVTECFLNSVYAPALTSRPVKFDIVHTNTLEVLDGRLADKIPAFKEGNVMVSCLAIDSVAVIDLESEKVVWVASGMWDNQHQPTVLENGNILLFDNTGNQGFSRAIEFDPVTREVVWMYAPDPPEIFFSPQLGTVERLPNGNTLISESTRGRVFEVTPANEIVWEFVNPHRFGDDDELIAAIFEVVRLPLNFPLGWTESVASN